MKQINKARKTNTRKLAILAIFSAIVAVLAYYGGFIKIGGFASISLTLIPVVVGAAMMGPIAGAWLGAVSGLVFFATPDAVYWFGLNIPGTIITVMVKGIAAGFLAGVVYKLLSGVNRYLAVLVSAIVCPIVNTGIFLIGALIFFMDAVSVGAELEGVSIGVFLIVFYVGLNFVFELLANIAVSPAMLRILDITKVNKK